MLKKFVVMRIKKVRVMRIIRLMVRWVMQKNTWGEMVKKLSFSVSSEQKVQHS